MRLRSLSHAQRRSLPSSSIRSNAHSTAALSAKPITESVEYREAAFVNYDGLAVDHAGEQPDAPGRRAMMRKPSCLIS